MSGLHPDTERLLIEKLAAIEQSQCPGQLRDYFAAHALQGLLAAGGTAVWKVELLADAAYLHADAMMRARDRGEKSC